MSVDNIHLNLKQKVNTNAMDIKGCSLLPDGRMVCSCYKKHIVSFFNKEGVELFQIGQDQIGSYAYDTLYIKEENNLAVSSGNGDKRCITIINIESKKVMTTISMDNRIRGMAIRGRTIYYCTWNKGLKMLNLSDKSVSDIINREMCYVNYVATFGNKLYYTNWNTHTVTCCDLQGITQWEFKDERVLKSPFGIPNGLFKTRSSLNSHCVIPCKSQHVTVCVFQFV
jgi:hypothetical protein